MATAVSIELDEKLQRFFSYLRKSKRITSRQAAINLLNAGYYQQVRQLHSQYLKGDITFRRMAKELGLEYRQLYALFEELNLPMA
jgi:hypothetical protein